MFPVAGIHSRHRFHMGEMDITFRLSKERTGILESNNTTGVILVKVAQR